MQDRSAAASEGNHIYVDLFGNILVDSSEQYKNQHTPLESAMNIITKNFKSSSPSIHKLGGSIIKRILVQLQLTLKIFFNTENLTTENI